jgi:hypothetical protein
VPAERAMENINHITTCHRLGGTYPAGSAEVVVKNLQKRSNTTRNSSSRRKNHHHSNITISEDQTTTSAIRSETPSEIKLEPGNDVVSVRKKSAKFTE